MQNTCLLQLSCIRIAFLRDGSRIPITSFRITLLNRGYIFVTGLLKCSIRASLTADVVGLAECCLVAGTALGEVSRSSRPAVARLIRRDLV